jgi:Flavin containing amine oxidoreductase
MTGPVVQPPPIEVPLDAGMQDGLELDVAIVGGGASGLYTGWRLATSDAPPSAHIFEMSDRIAGRLQTVFMPGLDVQCEMGGMRYLDAQAMVAALIEKVFARELTPTPFPMGDPATHLFYLRKQRFPANSWSVAQGKGEKFQVTYVLNDDDVGFSGDQLFNKVIYDVLMADPWFANGPYAKLVTNTAPYTYKFMLTATEWNEIKPRLRYNFAGPYEGMLVNELGFWNLLEDQVSMEGYLYLADVGGYYSNTLNWNAAEAFPYMVGDFSDADTQYKTIEGGYDRILYAIGKAYTDQPGAKIWACNRLVSFRKSRADEPRRYALRFNNAMSELDWTVYADAIVLGMPRRSLELLEQEDDGAEFFFAPAGPKSKIQAGINSVIPEPSFKLMMAFEQDWWTPDFGAQAGESITDLPMRQCYYFGVDRENGHSLFMASYNDMRAETFWEALQRGSPERWQPRATRFASADALITDVDWRLVAPRAMVAAAMQQVRELHGRADIPDPYMAYYKNWTEDPFGGGYHGWAPGNEVWQTMPYMRQPYPDERVHIVGEAYSDQQGWVEGALTVAELMLEESFGLARPGWIPADYDLGW